MGKNQPNVQNPKRNKTGKKKKKKWKTRIETKLVFISQREINYRNSRCSRNITNR